MPKLNFNIGDEAWLATFEATDAYVTCPDCGGTGRLRVTFHDETTVSIECRNCAPGYDPPRGVVRVCDRKPTAKRCVVTGVETGSASYDAEVSYHLGWSGYTYIGTDLDIRATEEAALARAAEMAAEMDADERKRVATKEKDTRSWAWNASHHRSEIKRAKRDLEYHTAKLNVAALKAKENKTAKAEG